MEPTQVSQDSQEDSKQTEKVLKGLKREDVQRKQEGIRQEEIRRSVRAGGAGPSRFANFVCLDSEDDSEDTGRTYTATEGDGDDDKCVICGKDTSDKCVEEGCEEEDWAQCDVCNGWVHLLCCDIHLQDVKDITFTCPLCIYAHEAQQSGGTGEE